MRRLIGTIGIGLVVSLSSGCGYSPSGLGGLSKGRGAAAWGTVKTAQGVPVAGVRVEGGHAEAVFTDREGRYSTDLAQVNPGQCFRVGWNFSKDSHKKTVRVRECGRRKVNIDNWPEEG